MLSVVYNENSVRYKPIRGLYDSCLIGPLCAIGSRVALMLANTLEDTWILLV